MRAGERLDEAEKTRAIRVGVWAEDRRAIVTSSWPLPVTYMVLDYL